MKLNKLLVIGSLFLLPAQAQSDVQFTNIECAKAISFKQMEDCSNVQLGKWDKALNMSYQRALEIIAQTTKNFRAQPASDAHSVELANESDKQYETLKEAQRVWIEYRDANCGFYSHNQNGVPAIDLARCRTKMTEDRTMEILFGIIGDDSRDYNELQKFLKVVEPVVGRRLQRPFRTMIN